MFKIMLDGQVNKNEFLLTPGNIDEIMKLNSLNMLEIFNFKAVVVLAIEQYSLTPKIRIKVEEITAKRIKTISDWVQLLPYLLKIKYKV